MGAAKWRKFRIIERSSSRPRRVRSPVARVGLLLFAPRCSVVTKPGRGVFWHSGQYQPPRLSPASTPTAGATEGSSIPGVARSQHHSLNSLHNTFSSVDSPVADNLVLQLFPTLHQVISQIHEFVSQTARKSFLRDPSVHCRYIFIYAG